MKKIWIFVLCVGVGLSALLGGCAKKEPAPPTVAGFSCAIQATYGEMEVAGTLSRPTAGVVTLCLTAPETLNGLSVRLEGETLTASLHGFSFDVGTADLPEAALFRAVLSALDAAVSRTALAGTLTEQGYCLRGSSAVGEFVLFSDPQTGALLSLDVPNAGLFVQFSDFAKATTATAT